MDYAIGDIHGCLDKVVRLLEVLRYDPTIDRLIFLGDYIDRGPDSKGVLDLLLHLQQANPANVFLMGNHATFSPISRRVRPTRGPVIGRVSHFLLAGALPPC
jgi:Calcineurin-like phosphoesterase